MNAKIIWGPRPLAQAKAKKRNKSDTVYDILLHFHFKQFHICNNSFPFLTRYQTYSIGWKSFLKYIYANTILFLFRIFRQKEKFACWTKIFCIFTYRKYAKVVDYYSISSCSSYIIRNCESSTNAMFLFTK